MVDIAGLLEPYDSKGVCAVAVFQKAHFEILAPEQWTAPMVFNSPHSGATLPDSLRTASHLTDRELHASEDSHIDVLFEGCIAAGAPLMRALLSRSYIDLNREPFELDPRMFSERLPGYINTSSARVACGLGTVPKTVGDSLNIYPGTIALSDALERIESVYRPYHRNLAALLEEAHRAAGQVLLVDCHSMPSSAVANMRNAAGRPIDVVLGDRFGCSCDATLVDLADETLAAAGLSVIRNRPYAGGFISECHGHPAQGRHALQIEINRALYMRESDRQTHTGFTELKHTLDRLAMVLATAMNEQTAAPLQQLAAE